jgi:tRNA A-37 threonylcarbamoyl transferase component Bud32
MIVSPRGLKIIDFGLSFVSDKVEDKAVDLHLFSEAVESKHFV